MKEFGSFGFDGQLPSLDTATTAEENRLADEQKNQYLGPIKQHEYDGWGWGRSNNTTEQTQQDATGDARPEINQDGEPLYTDSVQYAAHHYERPIADQRHSDQIEDRHLTTNNVHMSNEEWADLLKKGTW